MTTFTAHNSWKPLVAGGLAVAAIASPAAAQFGEAAGFGQVMAPYFLRRDLNMISDGLDLDASQAGIIEAMFFDYEDEHNASKERMLESIKGLKDVANDLDKSQMLELVFRPFEDKAEEWERMKGEFLENIQLLLSEHQREQWPEFRRELRRHKELPNGEFSGEAVDLINLLNQIDPAAARLTPIADLLDQYAIDLDAALKDREKIMGESRLVMMRTIRDEDHQTALVLYEQQIHASVDVRDVNDQYLEAIASAIGGETGDEFRSEALTRGYRRVFRATAGQRLIRAAGDLETISEETRGAILELESAFLAELDLINEDLVRLIRSYEPDEALYRAQRFAARDGSLAKPKAPADPTRKGFSNRTKLDERYVEMLKGLLTKGEFASLPGASRFLRRERSEMDSSNPDPKRREKGPGGRRGRPDGIGAGG